MQKMIGLLKQLGASEALSAEIVAEMKAYEVSVRANERAKVEKVLGEVKARCVRYVEEQVVRNARKVKVFLESKERDLAERSERARKLEESEATSMLKQISSVMNGGTPDVSVDQVRQMAALKKTQGRLEEAFREQKTENARLVATANRANTIAEKALEKARTYHAMLSKAGLLESKTRQTRPSAPRRAVVEGRERRPGIGSSRVRTEAPKSGRTVGDGMRSNDPVVNQIARVISEDA